MLHGCDWHDGAETGSRKDVETRCPQRSKRWRLYWNPQGARDEKLDQSKVEYIVVEKRKGIKNQIIAEVMNITVRYIQKM